MIDCLAEKETFFRKLPVHRAFSLNFFGSECRYAEPMSISSRNRFGNQTLFSEMGIAMNIELTREQYEALLKSLAITRFLYHSILEEEDPAPDRLDSYDAYEDMEQQILSYAKALEVSHLVAYDTEEELHYLTREFEEKTDISDLITEYQDSIFWDELVQRLASRDFLRTYSESEIKSMAIEERIEKEAPFITRYEDVFTESGIDTLELK